MDAMIFAAGLGTRLRPLTNETPKALIDIAGRPVLAHVADRLIEAGADRLIINTHPFPDRIENYVRDEGSFGVEVLFSHEPEKPLDTGGGLRQAAPLFRRDGPFLIHNCDVISDVDLKGLIDAQRGADPDVLATLAVIPPSETRYLLFDDDGLCGYSPRGGGDEVLAHSIRGTPERRDFTGIHAASPELLDALPDEPVFSILTHYLDLVKKGKRINRFDQLDAKWLDIGTTEKLEEARRLKGSEARRL